MKDEFERLLEYVLAAPALETRLRGLGDRRLFVRRVVEIAAENDLRIKPEDVEEALREARLRWLERWI